MLQNENFSWRVDTQNNKIVFDKFPTGTYHVAITAETNVPSKMSGTLEVTYDVTKYVTVTVKPKSIENNNDITVKINGQDAPYKIPYARGSQLVGVQVYDNGKDVTEYFDISGEMLALNVYDYQVVVTAKEGSVSYEITAGADIASVDASGQITVSGVGKVTVKATSTREGYHPRYATKTFEVKKRILTPSAKTAYSGNTRTYNGKNSVDVAVTLVNDVVGDNVSASAGGTRVNPDAGKSKIVYVSGITLSDTEHYTLSTTSLHTTVNIDPIKITGFEISALDKKYDGNKMAEVSVDSISDVLAEDKGLVSLVGNAELKMQATISRLPLHQHRLRAQKRPTIHLPM